MKSTRRLSRRIALTGGAVVLLLACCTWYPAASARLEASPLDKLRAWCGGDESPCACDQGCCAPWRPRDACDEGVDGEWYWLRSPDQEKRVVASLYNRYCIRCHGVDGRGVWDIPGRPRFHQRPLAGSRVRTPSERIIMEGRGAVMPPFRGALTLEEAWAIGRYLHTFVPGTEVSRPDFHDAATPAKPDAKDARSPKTGAAGQVVSPSSRQATRTVSPLPFYRPVASSAALSALPFPAFLPTNKLRGLAERRGSLIAFVPRASISFTFRPDSQGSSSIPE